MNQNNSTLLVLGLMLALAAVVAVAPIISEMAYARAAAGDPGQKGRAITSVRCLPTGCTASASATGSAGGGGGSGGGPGGGPGSAGGRGTGISTNVVSPPPPPTPQPCTVFQLC
jgi:hypothetical protein